jgi:transposase
MEHFKYFENILQQHFYYNKARIKFITSFVISMIKVRTVRLNDISLSLNHCAKHISNYRRIQRFFSNCEINYDQLSNFVKALLPEIKFILTLDRTNWKFGKTDINILMLAIVYKDTSIPLCWELLNKRGNSSFEERKKLVKKAIQILGKDRINSIVADREFGSEKFFNYLTQEEIVFHIRIRKTSAISKYGTTIKHVRDFFKYFKSFRYYTVPQKQLIYNQFLYIGGHKTRNDYFILASNDKPMNALKDYKQRWTIEKLFGYLKTRGFDFEQTHITDPQKIKKLIFLLTIAFTWSYMTGVWLDESIKIKIKSNGRKEISVFRKGLDHLRFVILNIDEKLNEFILLTKILSCA